MTQRPRRGKWRLRFTIGLLLLFLLTNLIWRLIRYAQRLFGQPRFTAVLTPDHPDTAAELIAQARHIAAANVRAAIEERPLPNGQHKLVLNAGLRNFREPWARDFGFASFGLVELNETRALRETLETFLIFQRQNGQFPVKIHSTSVLTRYLHSLFQRQQPIHIPLHPKHKTAHNTNSLDGNALIIIAALNYLRRVNDETFARTHWQSLKQGLFWLEAQALAEDGLLHQGIFTDWADSIRRDGCIHYTNVLYWKAVHEFARDADKYGMTADSRYFAIKAEQLKRSINDHFWRDDLGFYSTSRRFNHILSSSGNLLAISWGLTTDAQARAILKTMQTFNMAYPVPTQVTSHDYGRSFVAIENRLAGIPHYHTSAAWLWLGAWHVIALVRSQRLDEAQVLLKRMSHVIVRDGVVHEVYGRDGLPLSTFWYESEAPLTWSAGLFVYAQAVYQRAVAGHNSPADQS